MADILSAIGAGLNDCMNPGVISAIVLFLVFMFFVLKRGWGLRRSGFNFIAGLVSGIVFLNLGLFDGLLRFKGFDVFLDVGHFLVAAGAVLIGGLSFHDWRELKKGREAESLIIRYSFLENSQGSSGFETKNIRMRIGRFVVAFFISFGCGMIAAFLQSAWPANEYVFLKLYPMVSAGNNSWAFFLFFVYRTAFVFPLVVLWGLMCFMMRSPARLKRISEALSKVCIIVSAVFLAYGLGFLFVYYVSPLIY